MNDYIRPVNDKDVITIKPSPIFVIKSKLLNGSQQKLFINVCHATNVPGPTIPFDPRNTYTAIMNNEWEIPIVTSQMRSDTDKKGDICSVADCIINDSLVVIINDVNNFQLKQILVEWCIESVEVRENVMIHRDCIKFPKMKFKGDELPDLEIRNDGDNEDDDIVMEDNNSVSGFLQMKKDLLDKEEMDDETNGLKTLFPMSLSSKDNKPLIQDISENDDINDRRTHANISEIPNSTKQAPKFNVTMRHTKDTTTYKLRIEIESLIDSSLDLDLTYNSQNNSLMLKNINTDSFKESKLEIPLPNFNSATEPEFKTFFIKKERKLYIFI
ncbi:hypothetical protein C6P45_003976 [Maudiozyma exigua]|uniref:PIH1 N-terminal domain-containing protein n=1 Tax=Maudiozyma exigua TaxID=34358 RepID=A0A9P6VRD7_MAUEX|nr:hypothetical protein C6P45_003976 [Kazachstania exigua]